VITVTVFGVVILGFVRWVDRIARLGRIGTTIVKVEEVALRSLLRNRRLPSLGGQTLNGPPEGQPVYGDTVGYIQRVDMEELQGVAEQNGLTIYVAALPGQFVTPNVPLAYVSEGAGEVEPKGIAEAFLIGKARTFEEDPRFGLVVLSEIASRALSPGINDPGSAVEIIDVCVRIFAQWSAATEQEPSVQWDRVWVPAVSVDGMFDDAFNAISRDGAGTVEVMLRLQAALASLASLDRERFRETAASHALLALEHAEQALRLPDELERVRMASIAVSAG